MSKRQVVLVTGASSGFGRLTVESLARGGHHVVATMRDVQGRNAGVAGEYAGLAKREDLTIDVVELDVTNDSSVTVAVKTVVHKTGKIDVLVNNAGIAWMGLTETFSDTRAKELFETNYFGVVRLNRAVLPHMRKAGEGLVVYVSSGLGRIVLPFIGHYNASKFALEGLAETYRYELTPLGIESAIVEPGAYPTSIGGKMGGGEDDPSRAEGYGPVTEILGQFAAGMEHSLTSPDAGNPQEVADAIVSVIESPRGKRPFRTPVGADVANIVPLNEAANAVQREWLDNMQLGGLAELPGATVTG